MDELLSAHCHCPLECEHPQPFTAADGRRLCGRCWHVDGVETETVPCTPAVCGEAGPAGAQVGG